MEPGHFLPVHDGIGLIACILGIAGQLWLARRSRLLLALNIVFITAILLIYLSVEENLIPSLRRAMPAEYRVSWIPALVRVWFLSVFGCAVLWFIRSRIPAFHSGRRKFLQQASAVACAAPFAVSSFGIITRKDFHVQEVDIKLPNLSKDLQGIKILQLSDVHLGQFYQPRDLERVVDASNQLRPDMAVLTGDFITTNKDPLDICLRQLNRLKTTNGVWACLGNHEMYSEVEEEAVRLATRLGIPILRREAQQLRFGDKRMNIVGVDYQTRFAPYLTGVDTLVAEGDFNLLLSHNPDVFPIAAAKGFDLTLSGHTHGGQVNVEIFDKNVNLVDFFTPYTKGLYNKDKSSLYVNSGLGTIGVPVRIGSPPEISLLRLCAS